MRPVAIGAALFVLVLPLTGEAEVWSSSKRDTSVQSVHKRFTDHVACEYVVSLTALVFCI